MSAPSSRPADGPKSPPGSDESAHHRSVVDKSSLRPRRWDLEIAWIANRQHGLISLEQLEGMGMDRRTVAARERSGRLHRIHRGVYSVGHVSSTMEATFLAAVLACDPNAALSHGSAAALWGFWKLDDAPIHVMAPNRRGRSPAGIVSHRDGFLPRRALGEAEAVRIVNHGQLRLQVRRGRGRRGVARLRLLLDEIHPQTKRTRSELERMFLHVCLQVGLPQPEVNVSLKVKGRTLKPDFLWREQRLILEADSRQFHDTDTAFVEDRRREQRLQVAGWRVSHCTWEQVEVEPQALAETVRQLLSQG